MRFSKLIAKSVRMMDLEDAEQYVGGPHFLNWMTGWHVQDGCEEGEPDQPPANAWIGVSAGADQAAALAIPARIHFLSCEPMLHEMDRTHIDGFDWVIFGGESGSKARRCSTSWIRDAIATCRPNGTSVFVKQMGSNCVDPSGMSAPTPSTPRKPRQTPSL